MTPRAWNVDFDREFFSPEEIAESNRRVKEMQKEIDRERVIEALEYLITEDCTDTQLDYVDEIRSAIALLKEQEQVINDMYSRYEGLCKDIREKYENDDVCGLCQYDGAYVGESGDWMNECPGFETNDCFCMKNSVRKMCGQPLIEEE